MQDLTLKQYADLLGLSYEAVRSSFNLHKGKDLTEGADYYTAGRAKKLTEQGIEKMNSFRQKPVAILPGDVAALNRKVEDLEEKLKKSDETIMSLEREKAAIQLELDEVRRTLEDRNTALIEALYRVQEMQGRLLTAADDDRQRGFFGRIFGRKRNNI